MGSRCQEASWSSLSVAQRWWCASKESSDHRLMEAGNSRYAMIDLFQTAGNNLWTQRQVTFSIDLRSASEVFPRFQRSALIVGARGEWRGGPIRHLDGSTTSHKVSFFIFFPQFWQLVVWCNKMQIIIIFYIDFDVWSHGVSEKEEATSSTGRKKLPPPQPGFSRNLAVKRPKIQWFDMGLGQNLQRKMHGIWGMNIHF